MIETKIYFKTPKKKLLFFVCNALLVLCLCVIIYNHVSQTLFKRIYTFNRVYNSRLIIQLSMCVFRLSKTVLNPTSLKVYAPLYMIQ